jgi:exonuclease SbcC
MKILKLRFENLNSLNGKWEIDFTHPEYVSNGIFAITGPTGAGKSTILDAICLALYGQTPRLGTVTLSANEIMSRRTGECYAEVEFATKGVQYRVNWSQRRSRSKVDGALQNPKHILYDDSGTALEERRKDVINKIEELSGLDFKRFTRSMLLAQGGFAVFLQASPSERAPILEEITGSEIYTRISVLVHDVKREKDNSVNLLKAGIEGVELLDEETEKLLKIEMAENSKVEATLKKKDKDVDDKISWITSIDKLRTELKGLIAESKFLERELSAFKPRRIVLEKARNAAKIDAYYVLLREKRKNLRDDIGTLEADRKLLPEILDKVKNTEKIFSEKSASLKQLKEEQRKELEIIKSVREFDVQLNERDKNLKELLNKKTAMIQDIEVEKKKIETLLKESEVIRLEQANIDTYIQNNRIDEKLESELAGIKERLNNLLLSQKEIEKSQIHIKKIRENAEKESANFQKEEESQKNLQLSYNSILSEIENEKRKIEQLLDGRLLREFRAEKDAKLREQVYLAKIANLEDERKQLEDNKACPLCGSTHHPYAMGNIPELSEIETEIGRIDKLIATAEKIDSNIKEKEKTANSAKERIAAQEGKLKLLAQKIETEKKALKLAETDLDKLSASFAEARKNIFAEIAVFGYDEKSIDDTKLLLNQLAARLKKWNSATKRQMEIKDGLTKINSDLSIAQTLREKLDSDLNSLLETEKIAQSEFEKLHLKRKALYGDKNPDLEERQMADNLLKVEKNVQSAKNDLETINQTLNELNIAINKLKEDIKQAEPVVERLSKEFIDNFRKLGFEDENSFAAALMSNDELDALAKSSADLDKKSADVATRKKVVETTMNTESAKNLTEETVEELREKKVALEKELAALREAIGGIRQRLQYNDAAREKIKNSEREIQKAEKEASDWGVLHNLIGSADGKKFRVFAQGLTFQIMVLYANKQLKTMTDRYLLVRDRNSPLELNVIDNYQAGEERSTKNLSGGESFIVSLALALGLSNMASRNVSVDSLFLDEGFGTLDEDSLEMALESLSALHQNDKLIGIISHVGALKERITTQINVTPLTGGKSEISGPGCVNR